MMTKEIYRGYDIESHAKGGFVVKLNGVVVTSQPSLSFCYNWIDEDKKNRRKK